LRELGGWQTWDSMQRYIRVLPDTVKSQYAETYNKMIQQEQVAAEEIISLVDFALMDPNHAANSMQSTG